MALRIEYADKYRLWTEMVRGNVDRLFVGSPERPPIGRTVELELLLPDLMLPIVVEATVVGRRAESRRFDAGVYLHIADEEVNKCRRFLGLESRGSDVRARSSQRGRPDLAVTFVEPLTDELVTAQNLSGTGMLVRTHLSLVPTQRIRLNIDPGDAHAVTMRAEVRWVDRELFLVGVQFLDPTPEQVDHLRELVRRQVDMPEPETPKRSRSVVVADDDEDVLRFTTTALSKHGFEVYKTLVGYEALDLIRKHRPRLAILDILMPGIDGADICRILRADDELAELPVIFVSALDVEQLRRVAEEAGATDYLSKPMRLAELVAMIEAYVGPTDANGG